VGRLTRELDAGEVTVVATGGLAELVCRFSEAIDVHDPLLTLEGLRMVHEMNVGAGRT
jgi:type III pantothenate kinase